MLSWPLSNQTTSQVIITRYEIFVVTRVIKAVAAFSAPKGTVSNHSLRLEASPSSLERDLSATQLPIVTTTIGWLISSVARYYVGCGFYKVLVGRS